MKSKEFVIFRYIRTLMKLNFHEDCSHKLNSLQALLMNSNLLKIIDVILKLKQFIHKKI